MVIQNTTLRTVVSLHLFDLLTRVKCYIWSITLYGAETWTFRNVDLKYIERPEMWCWKRLENMGWKYRVKNEVLHRINEERNILHAIKRRRSNWICHILHRNCLLKRVIEGKMEGTRRWGGRHKQLLGDLKETIRYWKLKEKALGCTLWRTGFERAYGPVVRQTT
jgi:hypothetical protein